MGGGAKMGVKGELWATGLTAQKVSLRFVDRVSVDRLNAPVRQAGLARWVTADIMNFFIRQLERCYITKYTIKMRLVSKPYLKTQ
ncbi:hypothetical protein HMF3257_10525 [Spirosoma telluris]|uniref:Uncharacterized protein n=1 Tax=Spirosoma telluris TaxID=2183553 RepID=A0A327NKM5_9BACT|nr:hypothetical protein HMF3257_10525 [Spirosoma telluris]